MSGVTLPFELSSSIGTIRKYLTTKFYLVLDEEHHKSFHCQIIYTLLCHTVYIDMLYESIRLIFTIGITSNIYNHVL